MPIPKRKAAESQKDFMSRCIPMLTPYHKQSEAIAICYDAFKGSSGVNSAISKLKELDKK
jgi:hypothetical protein